MLKQIHLTPAYLQHRTHTYKPKSDISQGNSYNFTNEELFNLTPDYIDTYLANKAIGTTQPLDTDEPSQGRSNSIEYAKKAILYFMPNKLMKWDLQNNSGNPTR